MKTYALTLTPLALSLEELLPANSSNSHLYAIMIRTTLVLSTLVVALSVPFFGKFIFHLLSSQFHIFSLVKPKFISLDIISGLVMALIGSLFTMLVGLLCVFIIAIGAVSSILGTATSLAKIIDQLSA
ncbi:hypothetical protein BHE74_00018232 [Ensete ventricosum]|uniref:Uncharacterized protein n=1 Tax=Ensete ventricosum TaxID=4639 RepID=A0A427AEU6_ENSVE|nr:hypothetical protein B296_00022385 [Ensete ventricosum]RWW30060.1 hypothetical protein GW17_00005376 [Ensete ventricosum]RWW73850.1 hypothetical protein BHE74_00018232 [Ensete ventricosum]RZR98279.1 hypothetical protein BHM03_00027592 [Ensete ventricosum]